ncbi:ANTAR domain-containing protein [Nocardia sp. R6R-6]|uniref:ANTAR domain-containing protein n=1 Tax=Nocardia sp. R6R-6 TaxID=3459303 RepID=UPI00403DFBFE
MIEQAKGARMLVDGVSAEQAFRVLCGRPQETDVKLRPCVRLRPPGCAIGRRLAGITVGLRTEFDHLPLAAHKRSDAE